MPSALLCVVGRLWECKFRERLRWAEQGFRFHRDIAMRDRAGEMERALPVSSSLLVLDLRVSLGNNSCSHKCDSKVPSSALPWHAEKPEKVRVLSPGSGAAGPEKEGQEDILQAFLPLWFPHHTISVLVSTLAGAVGLPWQELVQPTSAVSLPCSLFSPTPGEKEG